MPTKAALESQLKEKDGLIKSQKEQISDLSRRLGIADQQLQQAAQANQEDEIFISPLDMLIHDATLVKEGIEELYKDYPSKGFGRLSPILKSIISKLHAHKENIVHEAPEEGEAPKK